MTVEFSARVERGTGSEWSVDIMNSGENSGWEKIGDLSLVPTGSGWTTVPLTITSGDLTDYLDPSSDNEILLRVHTANKLQVRCV